jgi:hypothetical protein
MLQSGLFDYRRRTASPKACCPAVTTGNHPAPVIQEPEPRFGGAFLLAASVGSIRVGALVRFPTDSCGTLRYIPSLPPYLRGGGERAMAASPKEFREFAQECLRWADETKSERHRQVLLDMAKTWMQAALQLERSLALIDDDLTPPRRSQPRPAR